MLEGAQNWLSKLAALEKGADQAVKVLYVAADQIRVAARQSITRGAVGGKFHVSSKPGEPPKADTHHLDSNIVTRVTGPFTVEVRSEAEYSTYLEYGTSKMAERPFMRPAVKVVKPKIRELLSIEVSKMVRS